jgi:Zn-dependent protease with chaperone function
MPVTTTDQGPEHQMGDGEVVNARRARQGFRDRPILYVLMISLALVVVAFGIAFFTNNSRESAADRGYARTNDPAVAAQFDAPEPAPKVVPSN